MELKELLRLAVRTAEKLNTPLEDIELVCSQLMNPSLWAGYFGRPIDPRHNAFDLQRWFQENFGHSHKFYVDAQPTIDGRRMGTRVLIDFSLRNVDKHDYFFKA